METVTDFIFLGSKVTADGNCSHEIKRHLFLGRKALTNLGSIYKKKANKGPVVMSRCGSWTIKKADHQIIDAFEIWCWRRLLRLSWTARGSNRSILKEIIHWKD